MADSPAPAAAAPIEAASEAPPAKRAKTTKSAKPAAKKGKSKLKASADIKVRPWTRVVAPVTNAYGGTVLLPRWHTDEAPNLVAEGVFVCDAEGCGRRFQDRSGLRKHHTAVHAEKNFVCTFQNCQARFGDQSKLRRHAQTHVKKDSAPAPASAPPAGGAAAGSKVYVCPVQGCGVTLLRLEAFSMHLQQHTSQNPPPVGKHPAFQPPQPLPPAALPLQPSLEPAPLS